MKKSVTVFNKTYKSIKSFCDHFKISDSTYNKYSSQGLTPEQIVESCATIDHEGKIYSNIKSMCKKWKVSYTTYNKRINETGNLAFALTGNKDLLTSVDEEETPVEEVVNSVEVKTDENEIKVDNYYSKESAKKLVFDSIKGKHNILKPDFIGLDSFGQPVIFSFWDCAKSDIDPWASDPRKVWGSWLKYAPLIKMAKSLNGTFSLIIFKGTDLLNESHVKLFKIKDLSISDSEFQKFYDRAYKGSKTGPKYNYFDAKVYKLTVKELKELINKVNNNSSGFTATISNDKYKYSDYSSFKKNKLPSWKVKKPTVVNGIQYSSVADAIKANGLKSATVYARMKAKGISLEDAINMGIPKK